MHGLAKEYDAFLLLREQFLSEETFGILSLTERWQLDSEECSSPLTRSDD